MQPVFLDALRLGWSGVDCFLNNPAAILSAMTGKTWCLRKETSGYTALAGELEILRFERKNRRSILSHFVVGDGAGKVTYDPYGESRTVHEGGAGPGAQLSAAYGRGTWTGNHLGWIWK